MELNLIDIPIRDLPQTGGRFSQLKRSITIRKLGRKLTIRQFIEGIEQNKYRWVSPSTYKQILIFLIQDGYITPKKK